MNMLISLLIRFSGLGWVWGKVDGYKTAIAGLAGLLHALSAFMLFLAGVVDQAQPLLAAHNLMGLVHLAQGLQHIVSDPNVANLSTAWKAFYVALGFVGIGHKIEKAAGVQAAS